VLSAVGVGWPDRGTALAAGVPGLGWPQPRLLLVSSPSSDQVSIDRDAKDTPVNGHEDLSPPGSDRVRNALAAAVSRGTAGAVMTAGAVDGALSSDGVQMPPQPSAGESQVVVPEAPLRNARLALVTAAQQVIRNGLTLLGVSAPESM